MKRSEVGAAGIVLRAFRFALRCEEPSRIKPNPASSPEHALLEMLSEVGVMQEVQEARNILESARSLRSKVVSQFLRAWREEKAARLCVGWSEELGLPWAEAACESIGDRFGKSRWVKRLKDGSILMFKP